MATTPKVHNAPVYQGRTFKIVLRWETEPVVYRPITGISQTAPVQITAPDHGLSDGWYVAVSDVKGMTQINSKSNSPDEEDFYQVTRVDADTIELNAVDAASFSAYVSGGYLRYNTPVSLDGAAARMDIKNKVGGTALYSLNEVSGITLDDAEHVISVTIPAADTADFTWKTAVYDLEVDTALGTDCLLTGVLTLVPEVTTSV